MPYVTTTNKNGYVFAEMSGRQGKQNLSWCVQTTLDLLSKLNNKFEQIWFLMASESF